MSHQLQLPLSLSYPSISVSTSAQAWTRQLETLGVDTNGYWPDEFGQTVRALLCEAEAPKVNTLSLFSGGGGLDIGFHDACFVVTDMVELEKKFAETLEANAGAGCLFNEARVHNVDIRSFEPNGLTTDFIIGGPPCQSFSAAGRRAAGVQGVEDPRGILFQEYVRLLKLLQPKGFLFENVYGITGANGGEAWAQIREEFSKAGYNLYYRILDAADYGVPQHRERLIIVGVKVGGPVFRFPRPTHGPDSIGNESFHTAGHALRGAETTDGGTLAIGGRWGHLVEGIPPGLNYSYYTAEMGHPRPVFAWRSKFSDFLYKADPDAPVRTIKAQGGLYTGPLSWCNRHFSVSELKRLQTFPDNYVLSGKRQVQRQQLGNSVPPQLARILALAVLEQIFEAKIPVVLDYMADHVELGFRKRKRHKTRLYSRKAAAGHSSICETKECHELATRTVLCASLSDEFDLEVVDSEHAEAKCEIEVSHDSISITCQFYKASEDEARFCLSIRPNSGGWALQQTRVHITSNNFCPRSLAFAWKLVEKSVKLASGIDDLVQLGGYYQYRSQLSAKLTIDDASDQRSAVLQLVTSGIGVGACMSVADLASAWGVSSDEAGKYMRLLRSCGFEVRNSQTNPQIPKGYALVPYCYPTLTSRSVQLRKSLD